MSLAVVSVSVFLLRTSSRDDDDEFLYGDSELKESSLSTVAPAVIPSPGENPFSLHSPRGTAFVFYSFRQNIIDFLLTPSSRARQSLKQMSEFNKANYHTYTLSLSI